jgi:hypothetical protein
MSEGKQPVTNLKRFRAPSHRHRTHQLRDGGERLRSPQTAKQRKHPSLDRLTYSRRYLIAISTLGLRNIHDKMRRKKRKEEFMPAEALDTHRADERQ